MNFPRRLWIELEDQFEIDDDVALRSDYSGRGMYGRSCIALVGTTGDLMRFVTAIHEAASDLDLDVEVLLARLARNVRTDSMGREAIFYFPSFQLEIEETP